MIKSNLLLFLGALFFWSATWSIIGLTQVNIDLDPTISVFIRFIIAGLIILIFVVFLTLILINENQKKKNVLQAENYIKAGIYLSNGKETQALEIFEEIIKSKNCKL